MFARVLGRNRFIQSTTGGKYGATDLELTDTAEPSIEITVSAAIKPKSVNKQAPLINLPAITTPTLPALNVSMPSPVVVTPNAPTGPNLNIAIVNPDASPFSDFSWGWLATLIGPGAQSNTITNSNYSFSLGDNIDISGGTFWSGVKPDGSGTLVDEAGFTGATQNTGTWNATNLTPNRTYDRRHLSIINSYNGRWTGLPGNRITGGTYYVAGGSSGVTGTEVFHLVSDVHLQDVIANLYGKAAFINAESWRGGRTTMQGVTINVLKDWNTVFNIVGSGPNQDASGFTGGQFSTRFGGNADITVDTKTNSIYVLRHYGGGLRIDNTGNITLNGASNIAFSFLGWVPNKYNYIASQFPLFGNGGNQGEGNQNDYIPYVKLDPNKPMKLNGDENVGIFFNKKIGGGPLVGVHQGYFELYFNIGSQLSDSRGQLAKTGYANDKTDGSVGVYAISGQRDGVSYTDLSPLSFFSADPIHDLRFNKFNITFGKYSKNGFMFLAKNGTVIDIQGAGPSISGLPATTQTTFSDGVHGTATKETEVGQGTIIAYAEEIWDPTRTGMTGNASITNKPTEIKVNQNLNMMSKNGKAFYAKAGGLVTVNADAKAYGYGSIIGLAESGAGGTVHGATVNINADITAVDDITVDTSLPNRTNIVKAQKFKNIGGYAKSHNGKDTVVNVAAGKNVTVNGIGAYAEGEGAKVSLNGTGNTINTGTNGGLYAANKGIVEFGGGTIVNKETL